MLALKSVFLQECPSANEATGRCARVREAVIGTLIQGNFKRQQPKEAPILQPPLSRTESDASMAVHRRSRLTHEEGGGIPYERALMAFHLANKIR